MSTPTATLASFEPDFLNDREIVKRTGISRATLQLLRSRGEGPVYFKVNRLVRYRWADVVAWIEESRVAASKVAP